MAHVVEINVIRDLAPYRLAWNALLPDTPGASFFHTVDWLELYWKHFGDEQKLRLLVVVARGKPVGFVPLCVRREHHRIGDVRVLTYPLDDWGTWFGPIGPNVAATMLMAMRHLQDTRRDWDIMELRWADDQSCDRARTLRAMRAAGFHPQRAAYQETSVVETSGKWQAYWETRPSKWRNNVRRAERQLETLGSVDYVRYRPDPLAHGGGDPEWELYDACCDIARASWQSKLDENTTLTNPRVSTFLREAHAAAARLGMVDLNLLYVGGQPAAFAYNYHCNGHVQGLRAGFNEAVTEVGSGNVLLARAIDDSFARGDSSYNLGIGWPDYKRRIRTSVRKSYRFTHYRLGKLRAQGVRLTRWVKKRLPESTPAKVRAQK